MVRAAFSRVVFKHHVIVCAALMFGISRDAPNAWPPHQYIALEALKALPSNVTSAGLPVPSGNQSTYDLVPAGQLDFVADALPGQWVISAAANATKTGAGADVSARNGTVVNGGNATAGEGWAAALQRELANRYFASALCSWCVALLWIVS